MDNDGFRFSGFNNANRPLTLWKELGYDRLDVHMAEVSANGGSLKVTRLIMAPGIKDAAILHEMVLTPLDNGSIRVENRFDVPSAFQDLPRVGIAWQIPLSFDKVEYLGFGPHENYLDRAEGAIFGHFEMPISDLPGKYLMPQSAGNRTGTRKLLLKGTAGILEISAQAKPFEFSLMPYSDAELYAARHWHELGAQTAWHLHLDAAHRGVGSRSCGPVLQEKYRIQPGEFHLNFTIS